MARRIQFFAMVLALVGIISCVSYDAPLIYHKNFQPGTHPLLRFDGYYSTESPTGKIRPVFFYRDGSVWFAEADIDPVSLDAQVLSDHTNARHSWGNFKIDADTIYIERFVQETTTGNFNRIILKGTMCENKIHWIQRTYHRSAPDSVDYGIYFHEHLTKPDSTQNWTRTKKKYN